MGIRESEVQRHEHSLSTSRACSATAKGRTLVPPFDVWMDAYHLRSTFLTIAGLNPSRYGTVLNRVFYARGKPVIEPIGVSEGVVRRVECGVRWVQAASALILNGEHFRNRFSWN